MREFRGKYNRSASLKRALFAQPSTSSPIDCAIFPVLRIVISLIHCEEIQISRTRTRGLLRDRQAF